MIELAILGLLREQERHGYELKKQLGELLGTRSPVSFGSLYPALARLERAGQVKAVEAATDPGRPVPSTGSLKGELAAFRARHGLGTRGGRGRKVYGITDRGSAHLHDLLTDPSPSDERTFAVRLAFCRFLTPAERLALFEGRRAELAARLAERGRRDRSEGRLRDRYRRALTEHDTASLNHDVAWIGGLIEAEHQATQEGTTE